MTTELKSNSRRFLLPDDITLVERIGFPKTAERISMEIDRLESMLSTAKDKLEAADRLRDAAIEVSHWIPSPQSNVQAVKLLDAIAAYNKDTA